MAKRNKKNIKINQRIKDYFDGDPYDVGITRVSSETLSELFATLGVYEIQHSREILVKTARMLWSEADGTIRSEILTFFANDAQYYKSDTPKILNLDRDEKIESFLDQLDASQEERISLSDSFSTMRSKKITIDKMESKLKHIRFEDKRNRVQKALDGVFDLDDSLEFNASFHYLIYEQSFHKILTLNTKRYSDDYIQDSLDDVIVEEIANDKEIAIKKKQITIDNFLKNLQKDHLYLTQKEITTALRTSPPKTPLKFPLLKEETLLSLISLELDLISLSVHNEELLIKLSQEIKLPFSDMIHSYVLELHLDLNSVLKDIWDSQKLDFSEVLEDAKEFEEKVFLDALDDLVDDLKHYSSVLDLTSPAIYRTIYPLLLERLTTTIEITPRLVKKTTKSFISEMREEVSKKQRGALLARTIRDFKNLFPLARGMRRKLTLHIGATNSGKTYQAMQRLKTADTGYYLAPLRLLALEGYENLRDDGIAISLITGEEQIVDEDATHISSTIEMLNFEVDVDVCVIDEVQMLDDRDRGWAWANAIIGTPAHEVIMTGSVNSKEAIIALAEYLGEELEIIEFERKNPLTLLQAPTPMQEVEEATAIIAFSRKEVLRLKQEFSKNFSVSVVYGNLSPEVRREEARRFREKETQILIATDAIAMGMNLPIKTILFSKADKFDGVRQRDLIAQEVLQISGRAGRYGLHEDGFVGALDNSALRVIKKQFYSVAPDIKIPFKVMANLQHIELVGNILKESSLNTILKFFVTNMEFNGPFRASSLDDMIEASKIIDCYDIDIATKYHLCCAPLTLKSPYIVKAFESYIHALQHNTPVEYREPQLQGRFATTSDELLRAEDMVKEISLYLWLSYRFKENFIDEQKARIGRMVLNSYIEHSLLQTKFIQVCRVCKVKLPPNTTYKICQKCFKKNHTNRRNLPKYR